MRIVVILLTAIALNLSSCTTEFGPIVSQGPEEEMKIEITGSGMTAEPAHLTMTVEYASKQIESQFEVFSSDVSDETVSFEWASPTECKVIFEEWDESPREVLVKKQLDGVLIKGLN